MLRPVKNCQHNLPISLYNNVMHTSLCGIKTIQRRVLMMFSPCISANLGGLWISRIRVDQIAIVLKPFWFGLVHRSGHTRLVCKSIGPYVSTLHSHQALWSARALEDERKWDLVILFLNVPTVFKGAFEISALDLSLGLSLRVFAVPLLSLQGAEFSLIN